MRNKLRLAAAIAAAVLAGRLVLSQPADDPLDPVRVAGDTHRLAFENQFVRVLDVHLPPGKVAIAAVHHFLHPLITPSPTRSTSAFHNWLRDIEHLTLDTEHLTLCLWHRPPIPEHRSRSPQ
jgi:hypothetical protein